MKSEEQKNKLAEFVLSMKDIILSKGDDYAGQEDRLLNFKTVAKIVGITEEQVLLVFLATKVVRLGNLMSSGSAPKHESITDTLVDLANYSALTSMMIDEKKAEDSNPTSFNFSN